MATSFGILSERLALVTGTSRLQFKAFINNGILFEFWKVVEVELAEQFAVFWPEKEPGLS